MREVIGIDHGGGGRASRDLVRELFHSRLSNEHLAAGTDAAVIPVDGVSHVAITTDAHVVKPIEFPGGDIGRLAVCGTVNDLSVSGAVPRYLTASFVLEEGFAVSLLERVVDSMAAAAREAGVQIVAGDTKVVEKGECDGLFITTTGVGFVPNGRETIAEARNLAVNDAILVNGTIGDHGAAIACARNNIPTDPPLLSDCNPLSEIIANLFDAGITPHFMRDATRGGLATVMCELAELRSADIDVDDSEIVVLDTVRGVCELYGFDPLYLANEGKFIAAVASQDEDAALAVMRSHPLGRHAARIGRVLAVDQSRSGRAVLQTAIGGSRLLRMLSGEQLPRIC